MTVFNFLDVMRVAIQTSPLCGWVISKPPPVAIATTSDDSWGGLAMTVLQLDPNTMMGQMNAGQA